MRSLGVIWQYLDITRRCRRDLNHSMSRRAQKAQRIDAWGGWALSKCSDEFRIDSDTMSFPRAFDETD
jgi:hypothetical protein